MPTAVVRQRLSGKALLFDSHVGRLSRWNGSSLQQVVTPPPPPCQPHNLA